jgi:hypothetical protein
MEIWWAAATLMLVLGHCSRSCKSWFAWSRMAAMASSPRLALSSVSIAYLFESLARKEIRDRTLRWVLRTEKPAS